MLGATFIRLKVAFSCSDLPSRFALMTQESDAQGAKSELEPPLSDLFVKELDAVRTSASHSKNLQKASKHYEFRADIFTFVHFLVSL